MQRLRYDVYVEELGRYRARADQTNRLLAEAEDDHSWLFYARDGDEYVASGRVTALAIAPTCTQSSCRVYMGAAGGGVWTTDKALTGGNATWSFLGGAMGSNAIGSILIDPRDATGNTVYVGTGEPNA